MTKITTALFFLAVAGKSCTAFENDERNLPNGDRGSRIGDSWGHSSNGRVNAFGNDYKRVAEVWAQLCVIDTDGDGFTNGEELGDPDCTWVRGQADPLLISDPTDALSVPGNPGDVSSPAGEGGLFAFFSNYPTYLLFHGLFMFLSWAILAPTGIYIAMTQRSGSGTWFKYHRGLMLGASATTLVGFGSLLTSVPFGDVFAFEHTHGTVGIFVIAGTLLNVLLGVFRPHVVDGMPKSDGRKMFELVHPWVGRLLLALGVYQIGTGLPILFNSRRGDIVAFMYWALMLVVFGQAAYKKNKDSKTATNNRNKQPRGNKPEMQETVVHGFSI